jgi:hypothetical protein
MRGCWLIWSAPTGSITAGWPATLGLAERSRCSPRGHQQLVWARQRQANLVRAPCGPWTRRRWPPSAATLPAARRWPCSAWPRRRIGAGRCPTQSWSTRFGRAGRRRQLDVRAAAIRAALTSQQLQVPAVVAAAYGQVVAAAMAVISSLSERVAAVETALTRAFTEHPGRWDRAEPARAWGDAGGRGCSPEFGDDPDRYVSAKARKAYAGTAPITRALGHAEVVLARAVGNPRLTTACHLWAFAALTGSPGAPLPRRPAGPRRHPPSGVAGPGQPAGRHPARLPASPSAL